MSKTFHLSIRGVQSGKCRLVHRLFRSIDEMDIGWFMLHYPRMIQPHLQMISEDERYAHRSSTAQKSREEENKRLHDCYEQSEIGRMHRAHTKIYLLLCQVAYEKIGDRCLDALWGEPHYYCSSCPSGRR